jgi:hypothetical protein
VTGTKKELALGLAFVAVYVCVFHFLHSWPIGVQSVVGGITIFLPIALNVAGWWRWRGVRRDDTILRWRKVAGLIGLMANSIALLFPSLVFFYNTVLTRYYMNRRPGLPGVKEIDLELLVNFCLILSLAAMIDFVAPRRIRLAVVLGGFAMGWLILSIPRAVL